MTTALTDAAHAVAASTVMALLPNRPRLLALGEPTHGERTLLNLRNELFRQLVDHEGYRTITVESDCLRGLIVNDYVASGAGTLDETMERGFSHGWGAEAGNRELVRWMREYNHARPRAEQLRFAGFDGPLEIDAAESPRQALTTLHAYLSHWVDPELMACTADTLERLLGADDRWTNPAAMTEPATSVGRAPEARELRLIADDLVALLNAQAPHLIAVTSPDELDQARLYGRTATGLLRYHFAMADSAPSRMTRLCALRDQMMAENLLALAERGPTLVYAHNSHLQRDKSTMQMWQGPVAVVERRRARQRPPGPGVRLPGHRPRHDPAPRSRHPTARHHRRASLPPPGRPLHPRHPLDHRRRRKRATRSPRVSLVRLRTTRPRPPGPDRRDRLRQRRPTEPAALAAADPFPVVDRLPVRSLGRKDND